MTIDTNELRRLAQAATPGPWYVTGKLTRYVEARIDGGLIQEVAACGPTKADGGYGPQQEANARLLAAANPATISELLDRLESAERELETERMRLAVCSVAALGYFEGCAKEYASASLDDVLNLRKRLEAAERERDDVAQQLAQAEIGKRKLDAECDALRAESDTRKALIDLLRAEIGELRAKVERMEKQEPHSYIYRYWNPLDGSPVWRHEPGNWNGQQPGACAPLYALPGAQQCKNCNGMGDRFDPSGEKIPCDLCESNLEEIRALVAEAAHDIISGSDFWLSTSLAAKKIYALPGAQDVPKEAIAKILAEVMDIAVSNGANSLSMPDEYVEVAAWLCGIHAQPAQRQQSDAKGE